MNASQLIERNVRAHTVHSSTSWHMVAGAHETTIRVLVDELNVLRGVGQSAPAGCYHATLPLGAASVLVEFEHEPEEGDGWNEPHHNETVAVLRVFLNGVWCDAQDCIPEAVIERWEASLLAREVEAA